MTHEPIYLICILGTSTWSRCRIWWLEGHSCSSEPRLIPEIIESKVWNQMRYDPQIKVRKYFLVKSVALLGNRTRDSRTRSECSNTRPPKHACSWQSQTIVFIYLSYRVVRAVFSQINPLNVGLRVKIWWFSLTSNTTVTTSNTHVFLIHM